MVFIARTICVRSGNRHPEVQKHVDESRAESLRKRKHIEDIVKSSEFIRFVLSYSKEGSTDITIPAKAIAEYVARVEVGTYGFALLSEFAVMNDAVVVSTPFSEDYVVKFM